MSEKQKDQIGDLRAELFGMLRTLRDPNEKIDIERFRLGNDIAQTIINSARVEVEFIRTVGPKLSHGSGFLTIEHAPPPESGEP
jgi:hypothetical protein